MADLSSFLGGFTGNTIGQASVKLYVDSKAYNAELAKTGATTKAATSNWEKSMASFKGAAGLAMAGAAVAVGAFAVKAVSAASAQEEALNKVNVIFGEASTAVTTFAETSAEKLGISETAALSAAGTFGNLFTNVGFAKDAAAEMSTGLVQLAADLASFNDIDPTEALEKLRAGLSGEAEPLRTVGVFLSEDKVKAEAYASGLAAVGAVLTDQQKIQARYNIILAETGLAQGDFARTQDSLANQLRSLQAQVANLAVTLGRALLPGIKVAVAGLSQLIDALPQLAVAAGVAAAAWLYLNRVIIAVQYIEIVQYIATVGEAWLGTVAPIYAVVRALQIANSEFQHLRDGDYAGVVDDIRKAAALLGLSLPKQQEVSDVEGFTAAMEQLKAEMDAGAISTEEATKQAQELADEYHVGLPSGAAAAVAAMKEVVDAFEVSTDGANMLEQGIQGVSQAVRSSGRALQAAAKQQFQDYRDAVVETFDVVGQSVIGFKAKFEGTVRSFTLGLKRMRERLRDQVEDLKAFNDMDIGKGLRDFLLTQGPDAVHVFVNANKDARTEIVDVFKGVQEATRAQGGELDEASRKVENFKSKFAGLNGMKAKAEVEIHYAVTGAKLSDLPGFEPA